MRHKDDYVVRLVDHKGRFRDVVVSVEIDITVAKDLYSYYVAALSASESKAKENERVVRVSRKGYS